MKLNSNFAEQQVVGDKGGVENQSRLQPVFAEFASMVRESKRW
jgi:hypothetical protein